ncbi:MAG: hypothetical protein ABJC12_12610 [Saprospiraceae bacterium]
MNKVNLNLGIIILLVTTLFMSCEKDPTKHYSKEWLKYEENWGWCYNNGFSFPNDTSSAASQLLKCNFNGEELQIIDGNSGFSSLIYYQSEFTTYQPNTPLTGNEGSHTSVIIFFLEPQTFRYVGLLVPFTKDSLNYAVQKMFSNSLVNLSGNFIESGPSLQINSYCDKVHEAVNFSTLYSTMVDQTFRVDSFSYSQESNRWVYHLEYSCDGIEVTNAGWNSKGKIDKFGNALKSDVLVENLLVNNLKCVIDFVLPKD